MSANGTLTKSGYVTHHLQHLQLNLKTMQFNGDAGFYTLNLDTMFFSLLLGALIFILLYSAARKASAGVPNKIQNLVEIFFEFADNTVKDIFHKRERFVGAIALVLALWIFSMNFMDLIPVDLLPLTASLMGVHYLRVVPTADVNTTFALSLSIFVLVILYNFLHKGIVGVAKEFTTTPFSFDNIILKVLFIPINLPIKLVEEVVKPVSLSLRLYGNLFAGELIFILIAALLPFYIAFVPTFLWAVLHILVISVQTYIFMMLSIVYLNMAANEH